MNYSDFADKMLIALYQESEDGEPPPEGITLGYLARRYGLPTNDRWLDRLAKEWQNEGLAEVSDLLAPAADLEVEIGGRGMRRVEQIYGGKDGVGRILDPIDDGATLEPVLAETEAVPSNALLAEDGQPLLTESGDFILAENSEGSFSDIPTHASSETWTGIEKRLARDPERVEEIKAKIHEIDLVVETLGLTNRERAKVKAITEALTKLVESPEPEWKAIVELLQSPTLAAILGLAEIAQLVLKIIFGIG